MALRQLYKHQLRNDIVIIARIFHFRTFYDFDIEILVEISQNTLPF